MPSQHSSPLTLTLLAIFLIALTACSSATPSPAVVGAAATLAPTTATEVPATATPTVTPSPEPTAMPTHTPSPTPEPAGFAEGECAVGVPRGYDVVCGTMAVPENRSREGSPLIKLPVVIVKSTGEQRAPDPVFHLVGGPGGSVLDSIDFYLERGGEQILEQRDYVFFNQRGGPYAEPHLTCPDFPERHWAAIVEGAQGDALEQVHVELLAECYQQLVEQGVDVAAYNSIENAADVEDLRAALGYEQINLYGISYGTRLALEIMRLYPEHIRSVIIDSVYPPQVDFFSEFPLSAQHSLEVLFNECASSYDCSSQYPNLRQMFYDTVDQLNAEPLAVTIQTPEGRRVDITVDGSVLVELMFQSLFYTDTIRGGPSIIAAAASGDTEPLLQGVWGMLSVGDGQGIYYAIQCNDELVFETLERAQELNADVPPPLRDALLDPSDFQICESWNVPTPPSEQNEPVSSDIPALVMAGQYDAITPSTWAAATAETLSNSFFYEIPGVGHGAIRTNECARSIALAFLDDPTTAPDTSCIALQPQPDFE